jgi:hypothetical protein
LTEAHSPVLAHGVGRLYESPIPLYLYLVAAAATVAISFLIRALWRGGDGAAAPRRIAGPRVAGILRVGLLTVGVAGLLLTLISGIVVRSEGFTLTALLFWIGLIVGVMLLSIIVGGAWDTADPWATLEGVYRIEDAPERHLTIPWWIAPAGIYLLFWFELVSGVGFVDFWIVMILLAYSLIVFSFRASLGAEWNERDPLSILFGFAGRIAPLRLTKEELLSKSPVAELDPGYPMPPALFASIFILLASTTFDNVSETVGWSSFLTSSGVDALPSKIVDSVALASFSLIFLIPFLAAIKIAHSWIGRERPVRDIAASFGWSLIPIGIAYVLAHNAGLLLTGAPILLRSISDPLDLGWNLLGTADLFRGYIVSPALVWFVEIGLIVGGHILGVLAAHRLAVRLAGSHRRAVRAETVLTLLMCVYTISTLWLLAQPLVA